MLLRSETAHQPRLAAPMSLEQWRRIFGHDLRAPLRQARCHAELLKEQASELSPGARADLDRLQTSLATLDAHWCGLLQWGGLQTEPSQWQELPLTPWLQALTSPVDIQGEAGTVLTGDPSLLGQLFQELHRNAIQHARGTLRIHVSRPDHNCRLSIGDDGPGLPADVDPALWLEPLTRGEHSSGPGMGLALVERICQLHGGGIQPANEPATLWHITLPCHNGATP